jgi:hypothetical protein
VKKKSFLRLIVVLIKLAILFCYCMKRLFVKSWQAGKHTGRQAGKATYKSRKANRQFCSQRDKLTDR